MNSKKWIKWSFLEACAKTASKVFELKIKLKNF